MENEHSVIYRVYKKDDDEAKWREYAEIQNDGVAKCVWMQSVAGYSDEPYDKDNDRKQSAKDDELTEFSWKQRFEALALNPPGVFFDAMRENDGCPTYNEKYPEAYEMLCVITESAPPFDGYKIEYFGEGEPWERDPDWDPDAPPIIY